MMKQQRRITKGYFDFARRKYTPLMHKLAFNVATNETQLEDLKLIGLVELLRCMICYDKRGSFITLLHGRLHDIFRHTRDAERRAHRIHAMPSDLVANVAGQSYDTDVHMMVEECLGHLNKEEYYVITELFLHNKTMREIFVDSHIVPSTICRIKSKALGKMKQRCKIGLE